MSTATSASTDRALGPVDIALRVAIVGLTLATAYIAKAIEIGLIALLAIDFARMDGNPVNVVKSELSLLASKLGRRAATGSAGA